MERPILAAGVRVRMADDRERTIAWVNGQHVQFTNGTSCARRDFWSFTPVGGVMGAQR